MIFSELYSAYYNTVAKIMETAFNPSVTEKDLRDCVEKEAFSESALTILPSLKSGKWPLLKADLSPVLHHKPTMPLTTLEKRWLKAIENDPRVKLFGVSFPELDDVKPLFTRDDYRIYDRYEDGDPFEDGEYIRNFRFIMGAIKQEQPVKAAMINRQGSKICLRFYPKSFEYSVKDDKIRIITDGCKYNRVNLGRIIECGFYNGGSLCRNRLQNEQKKDLTLMIINERNALERTMLHFAHFEKQAERLEDGRYILRLKYYGDDETEMVIRVLSFGPCVKVLGPESFVNLIKKRLISQKDCGL